MKLRYMLLILLTGYAGWAQADIYKYVSPDGHVTYSSKPIKGAKKLKLGPLPTEKPFKATHEEEMRVKQETQKQRDEERFRILQNELTSEEKQLADAKQKLQDAKDTPEVYHTKDGKTYRNVVKYEQNVKNAQKEVDLHQKNVDALKSELSRYE